MLRPMALVLGAWALLAGVARGAETPPPLTAAPCTEIASPRGERFELGLLYQSLVPSGLPNLNVTMPVFGPVVGLPLFGGTLQFQAVYGSDTGVSLYLAETTYRVEIPSPYVNLFALFGAHFLHYSVLNQPSFGRFGTNFGLGASFMMSRTFEMAITLRTYIQQRSTITFGGGFSFLL